MVVRVHQVEMQAGELEVRRIWRARYVALRSVHRSPFGTLVDLDPGALKDMPTLGVAVVAVPGLGVGGGVDLEEVPASVQAILAPAGEERVPNLLLVVVQIR